MKKLGKNLEKILEKKGRSKKKSTKQHSQSTIDIDRFTCKYFTSSIRQKTALP